jgi:large subunit ribosomal protein L4
MASKTFKYKVLNNVSQPTRTFSNLFSENKEKKISFDVAEKAKYLVHHALKIAISNNTQFTSSTKTKSEVRGGGRKPWKQKGTGRARAGSNRSPLWRGGGVIFGPKMRIINKKINKKEKQLALRTILYNKQKEISIFKKFELKKPKTSNVIDNFSKIDFNLNQKNLIISSEPNKNLKLAIQNLKNCEYLLANQLNIESLIKAEKIIIDEISLQIIQEMYCGKD